MGQRTDLTEIVQAIAKACRQDQIPVRQAVEQIDSAIGGITRVHYQDDLTFRIWSGDTGYSIKCRGLRAREIPRLRGLAALAYEQARAHGSIKPGEVHIEDASSKHYTPGFAKLLTWAQYA